MVVVEHNQLGPVREDVFSCLQDIGHLSFALIRVFQGLRSVYKEKGLWEGIKLTGLGNGFDQDDTLKENKKNVRSLPGLCLMMIKCL